MRRIPLLVCVSIVAIGLPVLAGAAANPQPKQPAEIVLARPSPRATARPSASPTPLPTPSPSPSTEVVVAPPPVTKPAGAAKPAHRPAKPAAPREVRLAPVTAYLSQAAIDQGKLVLWRSKPPWLIAGHDNMGWSWLDDIATGRIVVVTTGPAAGRYRVVDHRWIPTKGSPKFPDWLRQYDLILQTCAASGTGFSLAVRA